MKLGLLSDTHDNLSNLLRALDLFRREGIARLIHCGDLTSPATARHLAGFDLVYLTGNMDRAAPELRRALVELNPRNHVGLTFSGEFGGHRIAATHGHRADLLDELVGSGEFAYVFHGHTHRRRDERVGSTRVINPGALGGLQVQGRTVCILDLDTGEARSVRIAD